MNKLTTLLKKDIVTKIVGFMLFLFILFNVFCGVTYLFRNLKSDRVHIMGIKSEPNNIDMVYIGGSAAFCYWQPLRAWADYGFTSYNFATNTIQAEMIKPYMQEVEKYHNPSLYVIGVRAFQYYSDDQYEAGIRNGTDSMNITSLERYRLLNDYFSHKQIDENTDVLSYYIDIAKYHTNTVRLTSTYAWGYIDNKGVSPNKGWEWIDQYGYVPEPQNFQTDERAALADYAMESLNELVEYCKQLDKDVLFVVCPYQTHVNHYEKYNTIKDVVEKAGFKFLNANDYYDEMEIDFTEDFYNGAHVNLFGAKKYTKFLEEYICENYDMPDHREDESFSSWDEDAKRFFEEEQVHAETVTNLRLDFERDTELAQEILEAKNLSELNNLTSNDRFTLLVAAKGNIDWPQRLPDQNILKKWGITRKTEKNIIRVVSNSKVSYSNVENGALSYSNSEGFKYTISLEDVTIDVLDEKIPIKENMINVILVDNAFKTVVAKVVLEVNQDGIMLTQQ